MAAAAPQPTGKRPRGTSWALGALALTAALAALALRRNEAGAVGSALGATKASGRPLAGAAAPRIVVLDEGGGGGDDDYATYDGYAPSASDAELLASNHSSLLANNASLTGNATPSAPPAPAAASPLIPLVAGRRVAILVHELSQTGAPRVATELHRMLVEAGAKVRLMYVPPDLPSSEAAVRRLTSAPARYKADGALSATLRRLFPAANATGMGWAGFAAAASHDLVVANTAAPSMTAWVAGFRERFPRHTGLLWFIHESHSVMRQFSAAAVAATVRAMPLADGLLYVSRNAEDFWAVQAFQSQRATTRAAAAAAAAARRAAKRTTRPSPLPPPPSPPQQQQQQQRALLAPAPPPAAPRRAPLSGVLRWGLPHWKAAVLASPAFRDTWRVSVRRTLGIPPNATMALALGYFNALKGYRGIFRAYLAARSSARGGCPAHAGALHLVLAGAGGHKTSRWLGGDAALVARLAGDTHVHVLPPVQAERFLVAADVFVSNSLFGGESWGLATLEAAAAGLVLLASADGGTLEQATHNATALLHSPALSANVPTLARHLCAVLRDPALGARLAGEGRRRALARFGPAATQAALASLLRQLAARAAAIDEEGGGGGGLGRDHASGVVVAAAAPPPALRAAASGVGAGGGQPQPPPVGMLLPPLQLLLQSPPALRNGSGPSDGAAGRPMDAAELASRLSAAVLLPSRPMQQCRAVAAQLATQEDRRVARAPHDELRYYTAPASASLFHGELLYAPPATVAHVYVPPLPAGEGATTASSGHGNGSYVTLTGSDVTARLLPPVHGQWVVGGTGGDPQQRQTPRASTAAPDAATTAAASAVVSALIIPATARHLLLVCHPDDELIFFGRALLTAAPHTWAVVVVTQDGVRSLGALCARLRLAACVHLPHADAFTRVLDSRLVRDLARLIAAHPWATLATHGPRGEYGHPQHVALHAAVSTLARELAALSGSRLALATPAKAPSASKRAAGEVTAAAAAAEAATTAALNHARVAAVAALYPSIDTRLYAQMIADYQALAVVSLGGRGAGGGSSSSSSRGRRAQLLSASVSTSASADAPAAASSPARRLDPETLCVAAPDPEAD